MSDSSSIKAVFFDVDGVVRIWDRSFDARAERDSGIPSGQLLKVAFSPDLLVPAITGAVTDEQWRDAVRERLQQMYPDADATLAIGIWSSHSGMINEPVLQLARRVRVTRPVGLISNATSRLNTDLTTLGIAGEFDCIVNSSEVGVTKPDRAVYETACLMANAGPANLFFTDDQQQHVDGAVAVGMDAHIFTDSTTLESQLASRNLI